MTSRSSMTGKAWDLASMLGATALTLVIAMPAQAETAIEKEFRERLESLEAGLQRTDARLTTVIRTTVLVGTIMPFGGTLTDEQRRDDWLPCDGSKLQVADYPELYRVIRNAFGGDHAGTYFNLPDLRGRFVRGINAGAKDDEGKLRDPDADSREESNPGGNKGNLVGSLQGDDFRSHAHDMGPSLGGRAGIHSGGPHSGVHRKTSAVGGNETRPKNVYVNWIIKARMIAP